ncbi:MAG: YhcH/YjgK/YiaL family protein [Bacteroidetes bacterium]|nr:YhcH/YjgK/YiaL family protein [Bacteroidota bacterium]
MIQDTLSNAETYFTMHPGFEKAFSFLRRADLPALDPGKYAIEGDDVFALVQKDRGKNMKDAHLEAHRNYIDIQFLIDGNEQTGWKPRESCRTVLAPYSDERDIEFYADQPQTFLALKPGMFTVFLPADAHAPMISEGEVHKCVVKVRVAGGYINSP